jgi:arylsulfatase A-like enzyme
MRRRTFLKTAGGAALAAASLHQSGFATKASTLAFHPQPAKSIEHVIIIGTDTFRRDHLGAWGNNWIDTRYLDEFARRSLMVDEYYPASFPTVPNRHDLLVGRFTHSYMGWSPLPPKEVTLGDALAAHGWYSMLITDTPHIMEKGFYYQRGFSAYRFIRGQESSPVYTMPRDPELPADPGKLRTGGGASSIPHMRYQNWRRNEEDCFCPQSINAALHWLERNYKEKNWLLYMDTWDPHEPWDPPDYYVDMYDPGYVGQCPQYPPYTFTEGVLTEREIKHTAATYAAEVTMVDRWLGKLLQRIDDMGLFENTLILFVTDHGIMLGEHGYTGKSLLTKAMSLSIPLYREIVEVPCIASMPGGRRGRTDAILQTPDIMPTILDAIGSPIPGDVTGKSFTGVLTGDKDTHRNFAVTTPATGNNPMAKRTKPTISTKEWRLMFPAKHGTAPVIRSGVSTEERRRAEFELELAARLQPYSAQLFHRENDPQQSENRAEAETAVVAELEGRWLAHLREQGAKDAILKPWIL